MRRRVVVTGLGAVTPVGLDVATTLRNLMAGASGVGPITLFDASLLPTRIAAEVKLPGSELGHRDRKVGFALRAAAQAISDASACGTAPGGERAGAGAGLSLGVGLEVLSMPDLLAVRAPGFTMPASLADRLQLLQTPADLAARLLGIRHDLRQPPLLHVSACAAGTDAVGTAFRLVASGRRDWMLAGGADSMINPLGVGGFCKLRALSTRNSEPTRASRPFDRRRDGFVVGEGAGMLVLEEREAALSRGAHIHAELLGYGNSFDAHGISEPHPEGRGAVEAMSRALREAGMSPDQIDCVNAHGTSTPKNDPVETLALKRLLGDRARSVPICATKSMLGHLVSAAGAVEAVVAICCMKAGMLHPTLNLDEPDPACDLDYVPHVARAHHQRVVLSTSFAFGGQNAALLIGSHA